MNFLNWKIRKKQMKEKNTLKILQILLVAALLFPLVSAEFWACFTDGQRIDFCNPKVPDRTCGSSYGCEFCMNAYNDVDNCFNQGNWMVCMGIPRECADITDTGSMEVDGEAPVIDLRNPLEGELYTSRSIIFDIGLDEKADIYYIENHESRPRWKRICSDCYSYGKRRSFDEGQNDLTIKAVDVVGNEAFEDVSFFIDSKKPKISKTEPRRGFADGNFQVQFTESNPETLILYYEDQQKQLDIENDCYEDRGKYYCDTYVDLSAYDGQEIEYYFTLEDIAGNVVESRHLYLDVDTTSPILNNPDSFWSQGEGRYSKYIYFNFNITEENFEEVSYIDYSDSRPRWRRLGSRLRDGECSKKKSFRRGLHTLDIQIIDEAGNAIAKRIEFLVDY